MATDPRYEHFSKGDLVRLKAGTRTAPFNAALHVAGVGTVRGVTNAGFRGLEYAVEVVHEGDRERCHGISAADLELVSPAVLTPWPRQGTYRNDKRVGA